MLDLKGEGRLKGENVGKRRQNRQNRRFRHDFIQENVKSSLNPKAEHVKVNKQKNVRKKRKAPLQIAPGDGVIERG